MYYTTPGNNAKSLEDKQDPLLPNSPSAWVCASFLPSFLPTNQPASPAKSGTGTASHNYIIIYQYDRLTQTVPHNRRHRIVISPRIHAHVYKGKNASAAGQRDCPTARCLLFRGGPQLTALNKRPPQPKHNKTEQDQKKKQRKIEQWTKRAIASSIIKGRGSRSQCFFPLYFFFYIVYYCYYYNNTHTVFFDCYLYKNISVRIVVPRTPHIQWCVWCPY